MSLSTAQNKRGNFTDRVKEEGELDPYQPSSRILLKFSSSEHVKIQSMKTLWNIQCEINPISLQLIFPLIDLAVGGGERQNNTEVVHQHTKVLHYYNTPGSHFYSGTSEFKCIYYLCE